MNQLLILGLIGAPLLAASCGSTEHAKTQTSSAEVASAPQFTLAITGMT
jgi:hypothetical protein